MLLQLTCYQPQISNIKLKKKKKKFRKDTVVLGGMWHLPTIACCDLVLKGLSA